MEDIEHVILENPGGNSGFAIRVVTIDGKQKTFRLANFTKSDRNRLEKRLIEKDLKVD